MTRAIVVPGTAFLVVVSLATAGCGGESSSHANDAASGETADAAVPLADGPLADGPPGADGGAGDAGPACVPGQVTLEWTFHPDIEGVCPVPAFELGGFHLEYGHTVSTMTDVVDVGLEHCPATGSNACGDILTCTYTLTGLAPTVWFFGVAAYATDATERPFSTAVPADLSCPDTSGCPDESGAITAERGFYITGGPGEQVWGYVGLDEFPYHRIYVDNYAHHGGPTTPGTYDFTSTSTSIYTCGLCVTVYRGDTIFMPTAGGTFTLTTLDPAVGGHFAGEVNDLVLQEVTMDPANLTTTPVPGGKRTCLPHYAWDVVMSES